MFIKYKINRFGGVGLVLFLFFFLSLTILVAHQFTSVFLVVKTPNPNTVLQMWSNKWWVSIPFPQSANTVQDDAGCLHCGLTHCLRAAAGKDTASTCHSPRERTLAILAAPDLENCILPQELIWVKTSDVLGVVAPVGAVVHMETSPFLPTVMAFWRFCLPLFSPLPPNMWLSGLVFSFSGCRRLFSLLHGVARPHLYNLISKFAIWLLSLRACYSSALVGHKLDPYQGNVSSKGHIVKIPRQSRYKDVWNFVFNW